VTVSISNRFLVPLVAKEYILKQKCLKEQIWTCRTLVQLLALYTDTERHNTQRYRRTGRRTDGRTDDMIMPIADHTFILCCSKIDYKWPNLFIKSIKQFLIQIKITTTDPCTSVSMFTQVSNVREIYAKIIYRIKKRGSRFKTVTKRHIYILVTDNIEINSVA